MHYSIWTGKGFPSGEREEPAIVATRQKRVKIHRKNPFPADLRDSTFGPISKKSRKQMLKSALELQINHNKQYFKRFAWAHHLRRKRKGGEEVREEEIEDSHSTPYIVYTDCSFIFNSFRVGRAGLLVGLCPFSPFWSFTTGIRNLRIHPIR